MKIFLSSTTLVLAFILPRLAGAQVPAAGADPPGGLTVRNVVFGHQAGMALTFDVYKPERPIGAGVISLVSGGYGSHWIDPEEERVRYAPMLEAGFVVFSVRHGMAPGFRAPDLMDQVTLAIRYVRFRAAEWGVDPDRLGITGGSSGGHLALAAALTADDGDPTAEDPVLRSPSRVAAVVAIAPPSDLRERWGRDPHPAFLFPEEEIERVSPILNVSSDDPPTLIVHGTADARVPIEESRTLVEALSISGVPSELVALEGAPHTLRTNVPWPVPAPATEAHIRQASEALVRWFEEHLVRR